MPVVTINPVVPLSSSQTVRDFVSATRAITNNLDNTLVQNLNLRSFLNIAISNIAEQLRLAKDPHYGVAWQLELEATRDVITGLPWCNLQTLVVPAAVTVADGHKTMSSLSDFIAGANAGLSPITMLAEISKISGGASPDQDAVETWRGNFKRMSVEEISTLDDNSNTQYKQSVCWAVHGAGIYFYFGEDLYTVYQANKYEIPQRITLWGYRNPLLDNLLNENATGTGWTQLVDLPDRYTRLAMLMLQKMVLELKSEMVPPGLDSEIAQQTSQISSKIVQELQFEQERRKATGHPGVQR